MRSGVENGSFIPFREASEVESGQLCRIYIYIYIASAFGIEEGVSPPGELET